jgi:hypothetical protein
MEAHLIASPRAPRASGDEGTTCNLILMSRQKAAAKPFLTHRLR